MSATHYVDASAAGANNGTSWTDAWTSISSGTGAGVSAGDTVYISTGSYASFSPKHGTVGSPISYLASTEVGHNGTVTFTGTGTWLSNPAHFIVDGSHGDGTTNFALGSGFSKWASGFNSTNNNWRISYINLGVFEVDDDFMAEIGSTNVEVDHCWMKVTNANAGESVAIRWTTTANAVSAYAANFKFHHNILVIPQVGSGIGEDGIRIDDGIGIDIYNNHIIGYSASGPTEHADGIQDFTEGSYIRIYNNLIIDMANAGINLNASDVDPFSHIRIYNNIIGFTSATFAGPNEGGFCAINGAMPGVVMNDVIVANNLACGSDNFSWSMNSNIGAGGSWTDSFLANNIPVIAGNVIADSSHGVNSIANVSSISSGTAATYFVGFIGELSGSANNFHLTASASTLLNLGTNLTAYGITTDYDGNARPATGNWDIGPFQYTIPPSGPGNTGLKIRGVRIKR